MHVQNVKTLPWGTGSHLYKAWEILLSAACKQDTQEHMLFSSPCAEVCCPEGWSCSSQPEGKRQEGPAPLGDRKQVFYSGPREAGLPQKYLIKETAPVSPPVQVTVPFRHLIYTSNLGIQGQPNRHILCALCTHQSTSNRDRESKNYKLIEIPSPWRTACDKTKTKQNN